jgi:DNA-binding response OmpR family regulator
MDARLIVQTLSETKNWPVTTVTVDDGQKAIAYLTRTGAFEQAERPQLIILDLNLPKHDGTEVLRLVRESRTLCTIKVVILSSSPLDAIAEKVRDARVEADGYFTKPVDLDEFLALGEAIRRSYERG